MGKLKPLLMMLLVGAAGGALMAFARNRPPPTFDFVLGLSLAVPLYWWYHLDKAGRRFRAGLLQDIGVAWFSLVGLPVYFVRTRGWLRGLLATAGAAAFLLLVSLAIAGGYVAAASIAR